MGSWRGVVLSLADQSPRPGMSPLLVPEAQAWANRIQEAAKRIAANQPYVGPNSSSNPVDFGIMGGSFSAVSGVSLHANGAPLRMDGLSPVPDEQRQQALERFRLLQPHRERGKPPGLSPGMLWFCPVQRPVRY